jgi:hypothetical protein
MPGLRRDFSYCEVVMPGSTSLRGHPPTARTSALLVCWWLLFASSGQVLAQAPSSESSDYRVLSIIRPANGETLFDNNGNVNVQVRLAPTLRITAGDTLMLRVDDKPATPASTTQLQLHAIERGTHTLQASIVDSHGELLITSAPITFYLFHASARFPSRGKK